jgi:thiamine biosynthesis lipoprotein
MGTRFNLLFPSIDYENGDRIFHLVRNEVVRIESLISYYEKGSEINYLNNRNTDENIEVCFEVFEILERCRKYYLLTSGAFDITVKPVMDFWNDHYSRRNLETLPDQLKAATGFDKVYLNSTNRSVSFGNRGIRIDLGGFGKGYALASVKSLLIDKDVTSAFISFGESSILGLGSHPNGNCWKVGINNLLEPGSTVYSFDTTDESVSTSGSYTITDEGELHKSINVIDQLNHLPVNSIKSVSVKSDSPEMAEVLSTAFLVMKRDEINKIVINANTVSAVEVCYDTGLPELFLYTK